MQGNRERRSTGDMGPAPLNAWWARQRENAPRGGGQGNRGRRGGRAQNPAPAAQQPVNPGLDMFLSEDGLSGAASTPQQRESRAAKFRDMGKGSTGMFDPPATSENRDAAPPSDPNNTGQRGTDMSGLRGGSRTPALTDAEYVQMLVGRTGYQMGSVGSGAPLPGTPAGKDQIALNFGVVDLNTMDYIDNPTAKQVTSGESAGTEVGRQSLDANLYNDLDKILNKSGNKQIPVDGDPATVQSVVSGMEKNRAPLASGEDSGGEPGLNEGPSGIDWSKRSRPVSRREAFLDMSNSGYDALRAADLTDGIVRRGDRYMAMGDDGQLSDVTREGVDKYRNRDISGQDLLSSYLADVPDKVVKKTMEAGNADVATPGQPSAEVYSNFEGINDMPRSGRELNPEPAFADTGADGTFTQPEEEIETGAKQMFGNTINRIMGGR